MGIFYLTPACLSVEMKNCLDVSNLHTMKSVTIISPFRLLVLAVMLFSALTGYAASSSIGTSPTVQCASQEAPIALKRANVKQLCFFQRIRMVWEAKKAKMRPTSEGEKASTLATIGLVFFIVGLIIWLLFSFSGSAIATIVGAPLVASSIVISLIVLSSEGNKKSKGIAKGILITVGTAILTVLLGVVVLTAAA